ncbi:TBC1 domain family protein [Capsaspora owczarzaki ATCC 30864]|uniref:TBC1 domain family protein, variant n=1 Tax=Capsaspora owczarzaki (strain ATCC 30864) TaxID=595528 RepID=A0A0D2X045_CAPO3|nr:TBC1 domain family protein [Capsaspora owczarzaki ATCC 30864]KJE88419.1 TBC1 domain family protein, variant [Capsaspora owczarzaki ATCC 30864]|eukprot:XP_004364947.1 TBC1 domain family protein [Capsaspora owczarzaki ATCC 30864]
MSDVSSPRPGKAGASAAAADEGASKPVYGAQFPPLHRGGLAGATGSQSGNGPSGSSNGSLGGSGSGSGSGTGTGLSGGASGVFASVLHAVSGATASLRRGNTKPAVPFDDFQDAAWSADTPGTRTPSPSTTFPPSHVNAAAPASPGAVRNNPPFATASAAAGGSAGGNASTGSAAPPTPSSSSASAAASKPPSIPSTPTARANPAQITNPGSNQPHASGPATTASESDGRGTISRQQSSDRPPIPQTPGKAGSAGSQAELSAERKAGRLEKFRKVLEAPNVDLDALKKLSWSGIPIEVRPTTWQLLSGYLPANSDRRAQTIQRKRDEYRGFVQLYFSEQSKKNNQALYRQIHIDMPRTNPDVVLFQSEKVQEILERILYIWAIRHPASGYVQGMNDLVTPFFTVFLTPHVGDADVESFDISSLPQEALDVIEADCFWCLNKFLDHIQDFYTLAQVGIQKQVMLLKEVVTRVDAPLNDFLQSHDIQYLQFSFRWMNCLLMRELPHRCVVRMWDTYVAEGDNFAQLHLYVCAAFLVKFSKDLRSKTDFQDVMLFLQSLPTNNWSNDEMELLLSEAFMWKSLFHNAQSHLAATPAKGAVLPHGAGMH